MPKGLRFWSLARWGSDDITIERAVGRVCKELSAPLPRSVLPGRVALGDALLESGAEPLRTIAMYTARVRRRKGEGEAPSDASSSETASDALGSEEASDVMSVCSSVCESVVVSECDDDVCTAPGTGDAGHDPSHEPNVCTAPWDRGCRP